MGRLQTRTVRKFYNITSGLLGLDATPHFGDILPFSTADLLKIS